MALNLKRVKGKNEADRLIDEIAKESESSSSAYTEALKNLSQPEVQVPVAAPATEEPVNPVAEPVETVKETKPAAQGKEKKATSANKGRKTKAELGEVCRVQFSTTLEPKMLSAIRAKAKEECIPFSCLVEKAFKEYLENH